MASRAPERALLGVCDVAVDGSRYRTSYRTNKVGGAPDWPPGVSAAPPRCRRCGAASALLVQVYCPLEGSRYHRTLHVFACACGGGADAWTLLRSQSLEEAGARGGDAQQETPLAATDWCEAAEDWGEEGEGGEDLWGGGGVTENQGETEAAPRDLTAEVSGRLQALSVGGSVEDGPPPPFLRPSFISVVDEDDLEEDAAELQHANELLREYEEREGAGGGQRGRGGAEGEGQEGGAEAYEKAGARHGDAVFWRFLKRIRRCPQQILRYQRGGGPLLVAPPPPGVDALPPPCSACGGARTFEMQLMPALVSVLQAAREGGGREEGGGGSEGGGGVEFGTVLLYTCRESCWEGGRSPVEEFCFLQEDPDQQLFR